MKVKNSLNLYVIGMVIVAAFTRLIPHAPNFTAVGAIALFAGSMWGLSILSFLVPTLTLFLTDLILGFHSTMITVYLAFIVSVLLGKFFIKKQTWIQVGGVSLLSSLSFFVITNFGVWAITGMYTQNTQGLLQSYIMALPFFENQILGDLMYSAVLFGSYALLVKRVQVLVK